MKKFLLQSLIVIISVGILAEIVLRLTGQYMVYSEINGEPYYTEYGATKSSWYQTRTPNDTFTPPSPDFHYQYITNSVGLREREFDTTRSDSVIRILVTGDSFAEGVGAPYDSTWPRLLEKKLLAQGIKAEVINAGQAGSDLMYAFVLYRDKIKIYKPDIVIASFNGSDYVDVLLRGGMERFQADGTVHFKQAPWFEPVYKHSRLCRGIMHKFFGYWVNGLFVSAEEYAQQGRELTQHFATVYEDYKNEAAKNGSRFVAVLHNMPGEIIKPANVIFNSNTKNIKLLQKLLNGQNTNVINLSPRLTEKFKNLEPESYSHMHDYHYNPFGYNYMAQVVSDSLLPILQH